MNRFAVVLTLTALLVSPAARALAHCQVPCGIYGDQRRFDAMLEDTATITKAIDQIAIRKAKSTRRSERDQRWPQSRRTISQTTKAQSHEPFTPDSLVASQKAKQQSDSSRKPGHIPWGTTRFGDLPYRGTSATIKGSSCSFHHTAVGIPQAAAQQREQITMPPTTSKGHRLKALVGTSVHRCAKLLLQGEHLA